MQEDNLFLRVYFCLFVIMSGDDSYFVCLHCERQSTRKGSFSYLFTRLHVVIYLMEEYWNFNKQDREYFELIFINYC